jgi:hypothetical protein
MLAVHVPEDVVLQAVTGERDAGGEECVQRLPESVRTVFLALPVAELVQPEVVAEPSPLIRERVGAAPGPETIRNIVDPVVLLAVQNVYRLPDPGQATALGGLVGFGAGQFHAEHSASGAAFAVADLALVVGGLVAPAAGLVEPDPALTAAATVGLIGSHFVQIAVAGPTARRRARQLLDDH